MGKESKELIQVSSGAIITLRSLAYDNCMLVLLSDADKCGGQMIRSEGIETLFGETMLPEDVLLAWLRKRLHLPSDWPILVSTAIGQETVRREFLQEHLVSNKRA